MVDLFYFPNPLGGLKKAFEILRNQMSSGKIDVKKFIKYTMMFPSISVCKRIGYNLDKCGVSKKLLMPLERKSKKTSLITLNGSKLRQGRINNKWKVIIDAS